MVAAAGQPAGEHPPARAVPFPSPEQDIIIGSRCSDDWFDAGATCGFAKDASNQDIMCAGDSHAIECPATCCLAVGGCTARPRTAAPWSSNQAAAVRGLLQPQTTPHCRHTAA